MQDHAGLRQRALGLANSVLDWVVRNRATAGLLLLTIVISIYALGATLAPLPNWDLIAYTALLIEHGNPALPFAEVHSQAYNAVKDTMSDGSFLLLTEDRAYRIAQYTDLAAFQSMMPFYELKWLYLQIGGFMTQWIDPVSAIRLMSVASMTAIGAILTVQLAKSDALHLAPVALLALAVSDFGTVSRLATPDAFAGLLMIGALLSYLSRRDLTAVVLLVLAVLARPDHAVIGLALVAGAYLAGARLTVPMLALVGSVLAYGFVVTATDHPGWWVHLWLTQIEYVPDITGFDPAFSLTAYLYTISKALIRAVVEETWPTVCIVLAVGLPVAVRKGWIAFTERETAALWAVGGAMVVKFMIFPVNETRFHFAYILFALIVALLAWHRTRSQADGANAGNLTAL